LFSYVIESSILATAPEAGHLCSRLLSCSNNIPVRLGYCSVAAEVVDKVNYLACSKASRFEKQGKSANEAYPEIRKGADLPKRRRRWAFFNRLRSLAALFFVIQQFSIHRKDQ